MKRLQAAALTGVLATIVAGCGGPDTGAYDEALALEAGLQEATRHTAAAGSESSRPEERHACSLLTREELEQIVGGALHEGERDRSKCTYHADESGGGTGWHTVTITAGWEGAESELQVWRTAMGSMDDRMRASEGVSTVSGDDLSGLGDEAFFATAGIMDFLLVRVGDAFVRVEGVRSREQTIAIARLAVERL